MVRCWLVMELLSAAKKHKGLRAGEATRAQTESRALKMANKRINRMEQLVPTKNAVNF
jgi:hypothetical protein